MYKILKIFICLFFIFFFIFNFQINFAKYVIEDISIVANINIDRCKPTVSLVSISTSNTNSPLFIDKYHLISVRIKIIDKNIARCDFSQDNILITVDGKTANPIFKSFCLISENPTEKIYEFSLTNILGNGTLEFIIPEGIIEDKSGLVNKTEYISSVITINNTL